MKLMEKILGTHSERELKRVYPLVDKIEALGPDIKSFPMNSSRARLRNLKTV